MQKLVKLFIILISTILVFEEWLWDALKAMMHRLSSWPIICQMECWLRALPAWASLLVLLAPAAVLLPFKLAGLWALANGHPILGVVTFLSAKIVGTALAAYLFDLVRDKAREINWFDATYLFITTFLRETKAWVETQPIYLVIRENVRDLRAQAKRLVSQKNERTRWSRKMRIAKVKIKAAFSGTRDSGL